MAPPFLWTNNVILEFIELYKREEIIWDPKYPQHKSKNDIAMAWSRIKNSLSEDCCIQDLKKKKESLMATFRLHINRKKKSPSYQTCWFAYSAMESFLGSRYEYYEYESPNQLEDSTTQLENQCFSSDETETHEPALVPPNQILIENPEKSFTICKQSNAQKTLTLTLNENNNNCDTVKVNKNTENEEIDEYELYGRLLAKKLRKLNEHQRDLAMHEIDNIMFRMKMPNGIGCRRDHNYSASPPLDIKPPLYIITQQNDPLYEDDNIMYQDLNVQPQLLS